MLFPYIGAHGASEGIPLNSLMFSPQAAWTLGDIWMDGSWSQVIIRGNDMLPKSRYIAIVSDRMPVNPQ
jgi:hypothetical protein